MKVAIKTTSTEDANRYRGIGFYTKNLVKYLRELESKDFKLVTFNKKTPKADIYHYPNFSPFFLSFSPSLINQSVITIHDLIPIEHPKYYPAGIKGNFRWQTQKQFLKLAPHIITDSIASQKSITKILNISDKKVTPIYLGPGNSSEIKPSELVFKLPEKFILYVGDINWNKNIMVLAQVCAQLEIPLLVVGKQAANKDIDQTHPWNQPLVEFQKYAKQHSSLIKTLGFVQTKHLNYLYQKALCCVCPSIAEGFGLPVLEAMINGCPVISSNATSLPEVGGEACLYFNPHHPEQLIAGIQKLSADERLRSQLIQKGLDQAKKFSWEKAAAQTLEVYRKIYVQKK